MIEILFGITLATTIYFIFNKILKIPNYPYVWSSDGLSNSQKESFLRQFDNLSGGSMNVLDSDVTGTTMTLTTTGGTYT